MNNTVIMSLRDYNAMKRKADLMDHALKVRSWSSWLDAEVDLSLFEELIREKAEIAIKQRDGQPPEGELVWRSPVRWCTSTTIAEYQIPPEPEDSEE